MSGFTPAALAYLADITEDYAGDRGAIMGLYSVFLGVGQFVGVIAGRPLRRLARDGRHRRPVHLAGHLLGRHRLAFAHPRGRCLSSGQPKSPENHR